LRDGGYHNNWDFPISIVKNYIESLTDLNVFGVELGFRTTLKSTHRGPFAYTTEATIDSLELPEKFLYAVMLNASELDDNSIGIKKQLNSLFIDSNNTKLNLIRIASHYNELPKSIIAAEELKSKGYQVAFNLMGINVEQSQELLENNNLSVLKDITEVFYLADSNGRLYPDQYAMLVKLFSDALRVPIGVHTHDNRGLALSNSLTAISNGASWVDATVTGMGRGPGNTKLESLILEVDSVASQSPGKLSRLQSIIDSYFSPEQKRLNWGPNIFYQIAAQQNIHPLRIQELLANPGISSGDLLDLLAPELNVNSNKFSPANENDKKNAVNWLNLNLDNREILVIANESLLLKYRYELNAFILRYNPFVVSINGAGLDIMTNVDLVVSSYESRISTAVNLAQQAQLPFLSPYRITDQLYKGNGLLKQISYPLQISEKEFAISKKDLILNSDQTVPYTIAILHLSNIREIWLAGVSGETDNSSSNTKLQSFLSKFGSLSQTPALISLTPTSLPITLKLVSEIV
jgi:4-hydroxy 2-oxovalerate aldolase